MHEIIAYSIFDKAADIYDTPLFFLNEVGARRWFYTLIQKQEGRFEHFKDDLELHKIAKFNVNNGKVTETETKLIYQGKDIQIEKKGETE